MMNQPTNSAKEPAQFYILICHGHHTSPNLGTKGTKLGLFKLFDSFMHYRVRCVYI
jgi:hypothetical protein